MHLPNVYGLILYSCLLVHHVLINVSAERTTYIVHMDKSSMPKAFSSHHYWYSSTLQSLRSVHQTSTPGPKLIYTYDHAFHGFTASMSKDELQSLKKSPGFISAYADSFVTQDTTHSYKFLGLNTATGIWPASQYGKDVIIGIIDGGILPESPSFKDDGMTAIPSRWKGICQSGEQFNSSLCNKKLIGARYFNEGLRAADPNVTIYMNSARDIQGHGTHVASIAAGNYVDNVSFFGYAPGTARGMAPRARLAAYKVSWREARALDSDIIAGIDQAVADGVDILSISFSARSYDLYDNPLSIASFGAREKGVMVCFSAGNRGPSIATITNGYPWAMVVAAGTIDRWFAGTLTLGNGKIITAWSVFPVRAIVQNEPLIYNETLLPCNSTELLSEASQGGILICNQTDDISTVPDIIGYLAEANVRAFILITDDTTILRSSMFSYPGVVITSTDAREVIDYARNSVTPTASMIFQQTILGQEPRVSPAVSGSSSRGPARSYDRVMKPDIMAPGVLILGAYYPYEINRARIGSNIFLGSDYVLLSGTSMACPHIAGVAALLKAAHPDWSPAAIQSAMMTTANVLDNTNQPIKDSGLFYRNATPLGYGAGQVDPNRALDPGLIYDNSIQDFVNLVCSMNFTREQTQAIIRSSHNCSTPSSDLNYPSFIALYNFDERGMTLTRKFKRTVTNVGGGAATYRVMLVAPRESTVSISPKTLIFKKKYEKKSYYVTIRYTNNNDFQTRPGSLVWIEEGGNHTVRSPVVVVPGTDNF